MRQDERLFVQKAEPDQAVFIASLGRELYREYFAHLWTEAGFQAFVESQFNVSNIAADISDNLADWFLIAIGGKDIGFAKLKFAQAIPTGGGEGMLIEKIYFAPEYVGNGRGQIVLDYLLAKGAKAGETTAWLEVLSINERAQRAYEKRGFTKTGNIPFSTDLHNLSFVIMTRRLLCDK